jgi:hypothetical protein
MVGMFAAFILFVCQFHSYKYLYKDRKVYYGIPLKQGRTWLCRDFQAHGFLMIRLEHPKSAEAP